MRRSAAPALVLLVLLALGLAVGATIAGASLGWADPPPLPPGSPGSEKDARKRVKQWLEDLKSNEYEVREKARAGLKRDGLKARDLLESAKSDPDPEVRRTVRALLARAPRPATVPTAAVRPGNFGDLGLVNITANRQPLEEALGIVGGAIGAQFEIPEGLRSKRVTLTAKGRPCFDVIEALLQQGGLRMSRPFDVAGITELVAADPKTDRGPRVGAGPFQMRVTEVSATRSFGVETPPNYAVKLQLEWAPFVQVQQYERPTIEVARDTKGRAFQPSAAMSRVTTYGISPSVRHHAVSVNLIPGEDDCKPHLSILQVKVPMRLRYDDVSVKLHDIKKLPICLDSGGKEAKPGAEGSVQFHAVEEVEDGRGQWVVDFSATLQDEATEATIQGFTIEEDGKLRRLYISSRIRSADGIVRVTARAYRGRLGAPKGIKVQWFQREERGIVSFRLTDIPLR